MPGAMKVIEADIRMAVPVNGVVPPGDVESFIRDTRAKLETRFRKVVQELVFKDRRDPKRGNAASFLLGEMPAGPVRYATGAAMYGGDFQ